MKPDTERKKYHSEKLHKRKKRLRAHLSKDLRNKLKNKKRSLQVRKGDTVKIMRGPHKGKEAKVSRVNTLARKIYLEGVTVTNARAKETFVALEPSNLLILGLESTKERKKIFSEDAFAKKKIEKKKEEPKKAPEKPKEEAKPEARKAAPEKPKEEKKEVKKEEKKAPEVTKPESKATPKQEAPKPAAPKAETTAQR